MSHAIRNVVLSAITITTLFVASCSDFLNESDPSNFTVETYFTKPEHARSSVNAIYANLRVPLGSGFSGGAWMMTEFATGLADTDLGQAINSYLIKDLRNTSDNSYGQIYWQYYYKGIGNANLSIVKVPSITMNEQEKKKMLGEAHFLRAFFYFNLVQIFGNIPLVTKPVDLQSQYLHPLAAKPEEIYELIVKDLKIAEVAGLPWMDLTGKVSLGAVKSLLAKVYLTMASYPLQKGDPYFKLAAEKSKEVIDSKVFGLFTNYDDLHDPGKKNQQENIFMVQFKSQIFPSTWQVSIIPYNKNISLYADETGGIYPLDDFIKSYDSLDLRVQEKQFFFTKFTHEANRNRQIDLGGHFIYKHFDFIAHTVTANSDLNWPVIRFADLLLIYAEAANESAGPSDQAYAAVNAIRVRAKLPRLVNLSKIELREAIWRERWHELCFENITWFDMVRLRKAFNLHTRQFEDYVGHKFSYGPVLSQKDLLFPIPTQEILNNPNLKQNYGY